MNLDALDLRDWMRLAACKGRFDVQWEPEAYDSVRVKGSRSFDPEPAKKICRTECPVIGQCLEYALEKNTRGVWGGTHYAQRWRMRQLRRRKRA